LDPDNIEVDSIYQLLETNKIPDTNALFPISQLSIQSYVKSFKID